MCPLSSLRLMASHSISILDLQSIEISILSNGLHTFGLERYKVLIVCLHLSKEFFLLVVGKSRRLALQSVEQSCNPHLIVVIVGQLYEECSKPKTIQLHIVTHPQHLCPITISKKGRCHTGASCLTLLPFLFRPEVVILYDHEHIARREFLLTIEHHIAYALVIDIGALVTTRDDHRFVKPHMMITITKTLHQFGTRHHHDVCKTLKSYQWQPCHSIVRYHLSDESGVIQYARRLALSQHLVEIALINLQPIPL